MPVLLGGFGSDVLFVSGRLLLLLLDFGEVASGCHILELTLAQGGSVEMRDHAKDPHDGNGKNGDIVRGAFSSSKEELFVVGCADHCEEVSSSGFVGVVPCVDGRGMWW